ncbi:hypothetical protein [Ruegeria halocynthiae]|uniref:hypothetical protein n=1 Tax=Ruegeria halocynthiae TaxID=985054 RepID=UPI00056473BA|nr:hypothetical protein [Ruegeria halocynthiae]
MQIAAISLHDKVLAYAYVENEQMSESAVGRLWSLLTNGSVALDESDFWLLVEMLGRKLKVLASEGVIAAEAVHLVVNDVLACAVSRSMAHRATALGSKKVQAFIDDMSRIRFPSDTMIVDHFRDIDLAKLNEDPMGQLPMDVQKSIAENIK